MDYLGQVQPPLRDISPALPPSPVMPGCVQPCKARSGPGALLTLRFFQEETAKAEDVYLQNVGSSQGGLGSGTLGPVSLVWLHWQAGRVEKCRVPSLGGFRKRGWVRVLVFLHGSWNYPDTQGEDWSGMGVRNI